MLKYGIVPLLRESLQKSRLPSPSVTFPSTSFLTYPFAFHHVTGLSSSQCCALLPQHVCQTNGSHSFPPPEPELHTLLCFFFSTQLLKHIMIIYTIRARILHHPACHILCSLLSPHSYHLSVPSGIRSFYQWYGASALSSVKSRSRWEGWCWKDSRQKK